MINIQNTKEFVKKYTIEQNNPTIKIKKLSQEN